MAMNSRKRPLQLKSSSTNMKHRKKQVSKLSASGSDFKNKSITLWHVYSVILTNTRSRLLHCCGAMFVVSTSKVFVGSGTSPEPGTRVLATLRQAASQTMQTSTNTRQLWYAYMAIEQRVETTPSLLTAPLLRDFYRLIMLSRREWTKLWHQ